MGPSVGDSRTLLSSTCRPAIPIASFKVCLSQLRFPVRQVLKSLYTTLELPTVHTVTILGGRDSIGDDR